MKKSVTITDEFLFVDTGVDVSLAPLSYLTNITSDRNYLTIHTVKDKSAFPGDLRKELRAAAEKRYYEIEKRRRKQRTSVISIHEEDDDEENDDKKPKKKKRKKRKTSIEEPERSIDQVD